MSFQSSPEEGLISVITRVRLFADGEPAGWRETSRILGKTPMTAQLDKAENQHVRFSKQGYTSLRLLRIEPDHDADAPTKIQALATVYSDPAVFATHVTDLYLKWRSSQRYDGGEAAMMHRLEGRGVPFSNEGLRPTRCA